MARPKRIEPGPGQESVWDYPRPPRVEPVHARVTIELGGRLIADTTRAVRVLETSHPPAYYLPPEDFVDGALIPGEGSSFCEFKGRAAYYDIVGGGVVADRAGWYYPAPSRGFESIAGFVSVYPGRMDRCTVDGETVTPQEGGFYGGWITANIVGPFKGGAGTWGW
ncbi:DUF427 domain-containing protein [Microcella humidisoli]|jgi:uncharacterized protein (DUF427 family)|uniref:DUF427 domain-containing protein n=1 Tax=Microcella humidisoli TaxID=2963406 RepID=A0ABY5FU88_9MICO|nr:DUF427 domain-containing protein [Microcella humidisoli]UTT61869.1 DUF427 domain-containing protein [Microcella humidisoli]